MRIISSAYKQQAFSPLDASDELVSSSKFPARASEVDRHVHGPGAGSVPHAYRAKVWGDKLGGTRSPSHGLP